MSMPSIPDFNPDISISREDTVNIIISSIAMEELALAHILNAEGEKLQYVLGTLGAIDPGEVTICDMMAVNNSIQKTLRDVVNTEMLLTYKLEDAVELAENGAGCRLTISGRKIWRDSNNIEGTRPPSVRIDLLRDNEAFDNITIDSAGDGRFAFECLDVWKSPGVKYVYRIDEPVTPPGYIKTIDGFNVINTIEPGSITINGTKIWVDNNNEKGVRPATITVNLLQNGVQIKTTPVTSPLTGNDPVNFSFTNVPKFDDKGNLYVYTVDEAEVTGYTKKITGLTITNTVNP